jgi:hypothetical protein
LLSVESRTHTTADQQEPTAGEQIGHSRAAVTHQAISLKTAPNGGSRAMAATSDRHVMRLEFHSASVLIAESALVSRPVQAVCVTRISAIPECSPCASSGRDGSGFTAWSSGDGRVRVKSSARAGGLLAGVTPSVVRRADSCGLPRPWCGVRGPCGLRVGLDGGGLPVTPEGLQVSEPVLQPGAGT